MATALPVGISIEDVEDADLFQRAALAALTGYCSHEEIGLHPDEEIAQLAWNAAEAFMEERAQRAADEAAEMDAKEGGANG